MPVTPLITIFVRHSAGCKHAGDGLKSGAGAGSIYAGRKTESSNGARLTRAHGQRQKKPSGILKTISPGASPDNSAEIKTLDSAVKVFQTDKKNQGISPDVLKKYSRELDRLKVFCERRGAFTVQALTRELLDHLCRDVGGRLSLKHDPRQGPRAPPVFSSATALRRNGCRASRKSQRSRLTSHPPCH